MRLNIFAGSASLALVPLLAMVGCASANKETAKEGLGAAPNDAQIAAIVVAANQVDTEAGKQALGKTTNEEVKQFAQQMVTDHTSVTNQAVDLTNKLGVTPEENSTSQSLKQSGADARAKLDNVTGPAFDKAYVDNEVKYHETVLNAVDSVLIPNAKNAELKKMLVDVRPAFVAHLEHAKMIQASLNKS